MREVKWVAWLIAPEEMVAVGITLLAVSEITRRLAKWLMKP